MQLNQLILVYKNDFLPGIFVGPIALIKFYDISLKPFIK